MGAKSSAFSISFTSFEFSNENASIESFFNIFRGSLILLFNFRSSSFVVEETPPSSSRPRLGGETVELTYSGFVELTGDTCGMVLPGKSSVLGLEVVLLASPFSTLMFVLATAEQAVFVATVVLRDVDFLDPETACNPLDWLLDLKVGVTVADGLLGTIGRTLPSTSGLIGVVVVEAPTTLGKGAVVLLLWLFVTGFTWPMRVGVGGALFGVIVGEGGITAGDTLEAGNWIGAEVVIWVPGNDEVICGLAVTDTVVNVALRVDPGKVLEDFSEGITEGMPTFVGAGFTDWKNEGVLDELRPAGADDGAF